jgi:hypothetical protein
MTRTPGSAGPLADDNTDPAAYRAPHSCLTDPILEESP